MDKKSIYGLQREQLRRILSVGTDKGKSWDSASDDQTVAKILQERLDSSFSGDSSLPGDKSLIRVLLDPESDAVALRTVSDYTRELSKSVDSETELAVIFTIYYAAAASMLVYHGKKIDDYSYESLAESFSELLEKKWMQPELKQLFCDAQRICREKQTGTADPKVGEKIGGLIGRYKLLSVLGEGGMGIVYLAKQSQPIKRQVALKVIKPGMDSARVIARFEAERQTLALLDHQNIAHVHDAGTAENGRPYFVMEYVKGLSITEHCDQYKLRIEDRLNLFLQVCHAVQYAHQKGIIHRDIKPSNIIVTVHGDQAVPKVIDFGVARAISQPLTERTLYTEEGQLVGTPEYMSPEQAEMAHEDIDTRSDVYSLGVLLYVLLTGAMPFDSKILREGGIDRIRQTIRQQEPRTPSRRLSSLGEKAAEVAQNRRTEAEALRRRLRKELEWIPLKAMRKEREHRYQSASELANDVRNYLRGVPVAAGPESAVYRFKKFVERNRAAVLATIVGLVAVILGLVFITMYLHAESQRRRVQKQIIAKEQAATLSRAEILHIRGQYEDSLAQLESLVDSETVGPEARLLRGRLLIEMGRENDAETQLVGLLDEPGSIAGAAHYLLARIYLDSDPAKAREHQQRAESLLGQTAEACYFRATTAGTPQEAAEWLSQALELDPSHYPSRKARALVHYALGDYLSMGQDIEAVLALRPKDSLGYALRAIGERNAGRLDNALKDCKRAIELCENDAELAELYDQRREIHMRMGNYQAALADARRCVELAPNQIDQFINGFHVFTALVALGDYQAAKEQHRNFVGADLTVQEDFVDYARRYTFDILATGQVFELPAEIAGDKAFSAMQESAEFNRRLSVKATRIVPRAYGRASWSPDGRQLAYGRQSNQPWGRQQPKVLRAAGPAVAGPCGIEILDTVSGKTRLLVGFGRDPVWSPDGKYIAFVRDWDQRIREFKEELWIASVTEGKPRCLAHGTYPSWTHDADKLFFYSQTDNTLCSIRVDDPAAKPVSVTFCSGKYPTMSPDEQYLAYAVDNMLRIVNLSSGSVVMRWSAPVPQPDMRMSWSPNSSELTVGGTHDLGVWIVDIINKQVRQVFDGPARSASFSPDGSRISVRIGSSYNQIWCATVDPNRPTHEVLAPALTREEYLTIKSEQCINNITAHTHNADEWLKKLAWISRDWYCCGEYQQALAALTFLDELQPNAAINDGTRARAYAFKAMALYQLGRHEEARTAFGQLNKLFGRVDNTVVGFNLGTPVCLGPAINSAYNEWTSRVSPDGLSLIFGSDRPGGSGNHDLWLARRASPMDDWMPAVNMGPPVNTIAYESGPSISVDGLILYFSDGSWFRQEPQRPGGHGNGDIWVTRRPNAEQQWAIPENLGPEINSPDYDGEPYISADGLTLYFDSERPGGLGGVDLWKVTRTTKDGPWSQPENLGPAVNSSYTDWSPSVTSDGLLLFFMSNRPGGGHGPDIYDIWISSRQNIQDTWNEPLNLGPKVNSKAIDAGPSVTSDGSMLFFHSTRPGGADLGLVNIWQVEMTRIINPNNEKNIDGSETGLLAHWPLDETEGAFAHETASNKDCTLIGSPTWQPTSGKVSGALNLDGIDDCVVTPLVTDPASGPFSVFVWVRSDTHGGVIISQGDGTWWGSNWLAADPTDGTLITKLADPQPQLESNYVITDGCWHHVGLVWDGTHRHLYVDGKQVAADAGEVIVIPCDGSLYLGIGKDLDTAGSWRGLIDDMIIHSYALRQDEVMVMYCK